MYQREEVTLKRDVGAIQIPDGTPASLHEGETVWITQELGGSFTVVNERGGLFRIDPRNADALGKQIESSAEEIISGTLEERVWAQMKKCFDPEIPVNIVDLGLVYDCRVESEPSDSDDSKVEIKMTLTAPGCGMGPVLAQDVKNRVEEIPGVGQADVEVVFDPPWNQNMMSEAARLQLGFF